MNRRPSGRIGEREQLRELIDERQDPLHRRWRARNASMVAARRCHGSAWSITPVTRQGGRAAAQRARMPRQCV